MTLCIRDIHWLAGLMEGEGCFTTFTNGKSQKKYPRLMLNMCDRDVVERANQFFKGSFYTRSKKRSDKHQPSYCLQLTRASEVVG